MMNHQRKLSSECSYHIHARSNNRKSFGIADEEAWRIFSIYLYFIKHAFDVSIYAFTMMPNHFHILCQFPKNNLSEAMQYFMRETSRAINKSRGSINHVYGGRFKSTTIEKPEHFMIAYKYVLQNPIRAGLTKNLCQYRYTSFSINTGNHKGLIPISSINEGIAHLIDSCYIEQVNWLHTQVDEESLEIVRRTFRRKKFKLVKEAGTGRPRDLVF